MSFIKDYISWRIVNEAKSVAKGDRSEGEREKVVIKTLDANSFEYKIINPKLAPGTELVNSAGAISSPAMIDALINNVNGETEITNTIGKLDDAFFKSNILVYEVKKDKQGMFGRDVQVIVFTKATRPQGLDASVKALNVDQAASNQNVDKSVISGLEKVQASASNPVTSNDGNGSKTKTELPAELAKKFPQVIKGATGKTISPSGKVILDTLVDIFKNSEKVSATSLYNDFAKEVAGLDNSTGVLSDATDTMIKAVKAGYGLKDTDNGDLTIPLVTSILIPEKVVKSEEPAKKDDGKAQMDNVMAAVEAGAIKPGNYTGSQVSAQNAAADAAEPEKNTAKPNESYFFGIDGRVYSRIMEDIEDLISKAAEAEAAASDAGGGIKGFDFQAYRSIADKYTGIGSGLGDVDLSTISFPIDPSKISASTVNQDVKKIQQALINKFDGTAMKGVYEYKVFKKYGADGKFGNGTKNLIKFIKKNSDKFSNDSTAIITKEFMMEVAKAKVE